jgi:hypothetical protein
VRLKARVEENLENESVDVLTLRVTHGRRRRKMPEDLLDQKALCFSSGTASTPCERTICDAQYEACITGSTYLGRYSHSKFRHPIHVPVYLCAGKAFRLSVSGKQRTTFAENVKQAGQIWPNKHFNLSTGREVAYDGRASNIHRILLGYLRSSRESSVPREPDAFEARQHSDDRRPAHQIPILECADTPRCSICIRQVDPRNEEFL